MVRRRSAFDSWLGRQERCIPPRLLDARLTFSMCSPPARGTGAFQKGSRSALRSAALQMVILNNFHSVSVDAPLKKLLAFSRV